MGKTHLGHPDLEIAIFCLLSDFPLFVFSIIFLQNTLPRVQYSSFPSHFQIQATKDDHSYHQQRRCLIQDTKKCNCPARIYVREIMKYTTVYIHCNLKELFLQIAENTEWKRLSKSKQVGTRKKDLHQTTKTELTQEPSHWKGEWCP